MIEDEDMPGTPPPKETPETRRKWNVQLVIALLALLAVLVAVVVMTAIPHGSTPP